jgi:WD40 repeat protein
MSDASLRDYAAPPEPPAPERRFSPWVIILIGTSVAMLAFAVFAAMMIGTEEPPAQAGLGLASVTMPDGTLLVLEDVTFGQRHQFQIDLPPPPGFSLFPRPTVRQIDEYSNGERTMVWFSRRDLATGRFLDFDWWSHSIALDDHGCEVRDDDAGLRSLSHSGGGSTAGTRPLSVRTFGSSPEPQAIIVHSAIRPFRHDGETFTLRLYNFAGDMVGEFDVPDKNPARGTWPVWTPEPLPAEKSAGDVSVRLSAVTAGIHVWNRGDGTEEEHVNIQYPTQVLLNGQPTEDWYVQTSQLYDALGNAASNWDCTLCPEESAWRLWMRLLRKETAEFAAHESWTATPIDLPERDTGAFLQETQQVNGVDVAIIAVGGPGSVTYENIAKRGHSSSSGGSTSGGKTFSIRADSGSVGAADSGAGGNSTRVDCEAPHVALRISGQRPDHDLRLIARDEQGREVKVSGPYNNAEVNFWFLESPADAKQVSLTLIVQEAREVEFFIAPPKVKRPPKPASEDEVLQRLAEVTQTPLLFSSTRRNISNPELVLAQPGESALVFLTSSPNEDSGGAWSPDGARIVYTSFRGQFADLFLINADGSNERQLTTFPYDDRAPTWSPDGQRICFCRHDDEGRNWELYLINADGTGETNLTNSPAWEADPAWSPDGKRIALTSTRTDNKYYLYVMNADGSDVRLLSNTPTGHVYPAWSPDSMRIAFTGSVDGHSEIFVCDADGGNERKLTRLTGLNSFAAWSRDGKQIAFLHHAPEFPGQRASLYIMNADGSDPREIAPLEAHMGHGGGRPAWKP